MATEANKLNFKIGRIAVIVIWAEDVPAAVHFYRDVLGLALREDHHLYPAFNLDGSHLIVLEGRPRPAENPEPDRFPLFALTVDNLDRAVAHLQDLGVALPWGIEGHGLNRWVMLHDPAGNLIELVQAAGQ